MKCALPVCDTDANQRFTISWEGLPKFVWFCDHHGAMFKQVWDEGEPVENLGLSVENPLPDPGRPHPGRSITVEQPPEGG